MRALEDYRPIVGDVVVADIHQKARRLYGKRVINVNSTYYGGGVAELLNSLVPLENDVGLDADWRILRGSYDFFSVTKKFHNALQGDPIEFTKRKEHIYVDASIAFSQYANLDGDCVVIHDPQPLPLVRLYRKRQPWIWRCHIDLSHPDPVLWDFLKGFILRYDAVIVSHPDYIREDLPLRQHIIHPAIDPLTPKNIEIDETTRGKYLRRYKVGRDKPFIAQISRFDRWKDPLGVLEAYKLVRKEFDCRLVMCGSMATDDPEGWAIYQRVARRAKSLIERGDVVLITDENSILVNALQREAAVIIQKSVREGFGLTVSEAMWKGTPVVASRVGGIPLQITDGEDGFLVDPADVAGTAACVLKLLRDPELASHLGRNARETVRDKFLVTRLLSHWLDLLREMEI